MQGYRGYHFDSDAGLKKRSLSKPRLMPVSEQTMETRDGGELTPPECVATPSQSRSQNDQADTPRSSRIGVIVALVMIAVLTLVAYSPVMFNFFIGDDFVHLTWLTQAVQHPELVLRNFYTSWLDGTTTRFYRPLISVFMFTDYLMWGVNGLGFRITNVVFHLSSALFIYLIVRDLSALGAKESTAAKESSAPWTRWALLSSAIFALYPLHPEAVSWITGRVDSVVTAFCLSSVWFYIRWRLTASKLACGLSLISYVLGLLSKEMAITIPAVVTCIELYSIIRERAQSGQSLISASSIAGALKQLTPTAGPFWLILAGYFVVRRLALGTFVGGYDDSLLFISDPKGFIQGWLHALRMFVIPINRSLIGAHNALTKAWEILLVVSALGAALNLYKSKQSRLAVGLVAVWLALCLIPVYKIFAIADDLQGSRLAYLASAPLSILLAYGLTASMAQVQRFIVNVRAVAAAAFVALCAVVLWVNNQPWAEAGNQNNAIRAQLEALYGAIEGDPQVLLIGLPDQINGAYTCRNSLWGMTKKPQLSRDINNILMVNQFEPIFPFGYLKDSIEQHSSDVKVFRWSAQDERFEEVKIPARTEDSSAFLAPIPLKLRPDKVPGVVFTPSHAGLIATSISQKHRPALIANVTNQPGWTTDFIAVDLDVQQIGEFKGVDLLYTNEASPEFDLSRRTNGQLQGEGKQRVLLSLRSLPEWSLGGEALAFKILLPPKSTIRVLGAEILRHNDVMPRISFQNSGYLGSKGYLHLSETEPANEVGIDATNIPGATSTEVEITRNNLLFEEQNCTTYSRNTGRRAPAPVKGQYKLSLSDIPAKGIYELRVFAKDKDGKVVGVCSDHIVISVD